MIPTGEAMVPIEGAKGSNAYYLVSDGSSSAYRARIRAPSFPHMQMVPLISKGYTIPDVLAILGAMDFVLADLDLECECKALLWNVLDDWAENHGHSSRAWCIGGTGEEEIFCKERMICFICRCLIHKMANFQVK